MVMKMPFIISDDQGLYPNWRARLRGEGGWVREAVWRRHQCPENRHESGWGGGFQRRRLVHVRDVYDFNTYGFVLTQAYTWVHLRLPPEEMRLYEQFLGNHLGDDRGDLQLNIRRQADTLEVSVSSFTPPPELQQRPWNVFSYGVRERLPKEPPQELASVRELLRLAPFQIELGCGPSTEAGIPELSYFHKLYCTQDEGFIFQLARDKLFQQLLANPEGFYRDATRPHLMCLEASPTRFYHALRAMRDRGEVKEPILTNNFDGLCRSVELEEHNLYGFDTIYPEITFTAPSLLVIGSHADRRKVRQQAREQGVRVVFLDPESYGGKPYPVEDTRAGDFILRVTADEFARQYLGE